MLEATEASYFGAVSKARISEAVAEACPDHDLAQFDKLKKGEAAKAAELAVTDTGWLPELIRE